MAASITRMVYLSKSNRTTNLTRKTVNHLVIFTDTLSIDFGFLVHEVTLVLWSFLEVDLGIICACVPCIQPLFKRNQKQIRASLAAAPRSLPGGSAPTPKSGRQWLQLKFGSVFEKSTNTWKFRQELHSDHSTRGGLSLTNSPSTATVEIHSLSDVRTITSPK